MLPALYQLDDLIPFRLSAYCGLCRRGRQVDIFELMQQAGPRAGIRHVVERLGCPCGGWASHIEIVEGKVHGSSNDDRLIVERPGNCGRYLLRATPEAIIDLFGIDERTNLPARYNIAPLQDVPVVRVGAGRRELVHMRWGFPAKANKSGRRKLVFNVEGAFIKDNRDHRDAFAARRCLLPADGFYLWKIQTRDERQPWLFQLKDGGPFGMAGIWNTVKTPEGEAIDCCALIIRSPNIPTRQVYDCMPGVLPAAAFDAWFSGETAPFAASQLLAAYPSELMTGYRVSGKVNNPESEGPELAEHLGTCDV